MNRGRLETVVRIRALQERVARAEVERRRAVVADRDRAVRDARDAVDRRAGRAPATAAAFAAQRSMLMVGMGEVEAAGRALEGAHAEVATSLASWTDASRRREGVERLDERVREEQRADDAMRSQAELDDLVVMRHGSDRR